MKNPQTRSDLIEQIQEIESGLAATVLKIAPDQFDNGTSQAWSAASYLKHLILSVKPFAKALALPHEQVQTTFGQPSQPSRSYEALVAAYKKRLDEGVKAEDFQTITPVGYRFPDGVEDVKAYLVDVWNESNQRLIQALEGWTDEDLDKYQLPHPALGLLTLREMLFFTVYHNALHWYDIQAASGLQ